MTETPRELIDHRRVWATKPLLRAAYAQWYRGICRDLSPVAGATIELGSGGGNFKEWMPQAIATDIALCPWADAVCDAHTMPFRPATCANIVMVDVLHHLSSPIAFFRRAARLLPRGGRILLVEPFPSPLSLPVYRRLHPEPFDFSPDVFVNTQPAAKDRWTANQAVAFLLFFRGRVRWESEFGDVYSIVRRQRIASVLYPASGGFGARALVPDAFIPMLSAAEFLAGPIRPLTAFRCHVTIERR